MVAEETLFETSFHRDFVGLSGTQRIPDRVSILRFRHLLEAHDLSSHILQVINEMLSTQGWHVAMRPTTRKQQKRMPWTQFIERAEKLEISVRAKVKHPFRVFKRRCGFTKVRYKG